MNITELEREENEDSTAWVLPITVADLDEYGIETNGDFGYDDAEHTALLHMADTVRLEFGVAADDEVDRFITVQSYEIRSPRLPTPRWYDAARRYSSPNGNSDRIADAKNRDRMWSLLLSRVDGVHDELEREEAAFQRLIDEMNEMAAES
jgi:hypothetical protein